jgi:aspartyl protease family protein
MKIIKILFFLKLSLLSSLVSAGDPLQIEVQALMPGMVVLLINGSRETLKTGNEAQGVKLISSSTKTAVLEVNGKQKNYHMGTTVGTSFKKRSEVSEQIVIDSYGMFRSYGSINGHSVKFLVDTGASSVAMSEKDARKLGIQYQLKGTPTHTSTASGIAKAWSIKLKTVSLGRLKEYNVQGVVVEGNFPRQILLGMTFLNRMRVEKEGKIMKITSKK